ncbi:hypothetical protein KTQ74_18600 [Pseudomonas chlororaphis]|uniref:hypothetical protein n=1 Tax=Pseudomonas chlororaphis TaxID=587753 RepID=UPI001E5425A4|nr:hypothetical protein [Pseudomonas chlororaphis]MCB2253925.1 hypothetical protein [Pseudomonas chlororaphis]
MNSLLRALLAYALSSGTSIAVYAAPQAPAAESAPLAGVLLAQNLPGSSNNPYNSPIRRANPNSMQGTQPSAPPLRGPNTVPVPRPPTLENGGIGNGYPRTAPPPRTVDPTPTTTPPRNQPQR